jgi:circadian clock protein KaiC
MEFLVRGITEFGENGVFVAFEETREDLVANVASLGFDLEQAEAGGRLVVDHIRIVGPEMQEAGEWDLDGLLLRLGAAIDEVGAKRVVIDTVETLFGAFANTDDPARGAATAVRLAEGPRGDRRHHRERGDGTLTRHGIEEYVSDCVIVLDHRVTEQTSTRRLRILKYRGSLHGTNEYPFLIGETGISVLPITSRGLQHDVSGKRVSTGVSRLDSMLGDGGFFEGSAVLVNGTAGTGKSTLAAQFCDAAVRARRAGDVLRLRGVRARDRAQHGLGRHRPAALDRRRGCSSSAARRPSLLGLEAHLFGLQRDVTEFAPSVVVVDPVSDLLRIGSGADVAAMLTRQVDFLKSRGVTALFTSLASATRVPRPSSRSPRSSTPGSRSARSRATGSSTACCTSSSRVAPLTPTRSASSC